MSKTATAAPKKKRLTKKQWANLSQEEKTAIRKEKIRAGQDAFDEAMKELVNEDRFREALEAAAHCHRYSFRNTLWVLAQRPDMLAPIASYDDWKKKLGYQVRKGQRGALIWVPITIKVTAKVADDPDEADAEITATRFRIGKVFTRDQVDPIEGEALNLDLPAPAPIEGDSHAHLIPVLTTYLTEDLGWSFKDLTAATADGALGWCAPNDKEIAVRTDMPKNAQVRTFIHELIHALGVGYSEFGRELAETVTDAATYLVCRAIGLDVAHASVPYVARWSKDDPDAIKREVTQIAGLADDLLKASKLDNHLALSEAEAALQAK